MPLFDQEKMVKLVSELRKSVARLRVLSQLPKDEFLVDNQQLHEILQSRLDDFKKFLDSMAKFLRWQDPKSV